MGYELLSNGSRVRLATYAPSLLGARFNDLEVIGVLSFSLVQNMGYDVVVKHNTVYSQLPSGTPMDAKDLQFICFNDKVNNKQIVLATAWIDPNSIEIISSEGLLFRAGPANTGDVDRIRVTLQEMGFTDIEFIGS